MAKKKQSDRAVFWQYADGLDRHSGFGFKSDVGQARKVPTEFLGAEQPRRDLDWRPPDFPDLSGETVVNLNYETTGLDWRGKDVPIAAVVRAGGRSWYLPWGHKGGGNIEDGERKFREWASSDRGLRGKMIRNVNLKFDAHMSRKAGVDLDELGCGFSDAAHWAGLLDDHRKRFNVDDMIRDLLGEEPMRRVDETRMAEYHAGQAALRSMYGVEAIDRLWDELSPRLEAEGLLDVLNLENECIPAVVEMEENGAPIDVPLLEQWAVEIDAQIEALALEVAREAGLGVQDNLFGGFTGTDTVNPDSAKDMEKLFNRLGIPIERNDSGTPCFNAEALADVHHPTIRKIVRQGKLLDLKTKYIVPYLAHVGPGGILRYELHQMRGDENGTVRGRFSASRVNIQQVLKPKKQAKTYGPGFVIRSLFIAPKGRLFVSGDASQIEYRIFADYANDPAVFEAYRLDPYLNFHTLAEEMIRRIVVAERLGIAIDYDKAKTCNFLTVYGGGTAKLGLQLGTLSGPRYRELTRIYGDKAKYPYGIPQDHPWLEETQSIRRAYEAALPSVKPLSKLCRETAKDRGYVKDMIGRRARFPDGRGAHAALNAVIQPSAAEVMKRKMVEVHRNRRKIGVTPRMTIHDDWLGDCADDEAALNLAAQLNHQSFPKLRVPLLWEVKRGPRWSECEVIGADGREPIDDDQFEKMGADGKIMNVRKPRRWA